jgi:hypothetical protein
MFILGDFVDEDEKLDIEYKEYCFKINVFKYYSRQELSILIRNGKFDTEFNNLILKNLYKYFDIYIPRYSCSFHNTNIFNKHTLYFGINDFKEITGIPFNGDLCEYTSFFQRYINMLVKTKLDKQCCMEIELDIVKCVIDEDILSNDIYDLISEFEEEKHKYTRDYASYVEDKKKWVKRIFQYKSKLNTFLTEPAMVNEFSIYLKRHNVFKKFEKELNTGINITTTRIQSKRNDADDVMYWLICFKDEYAEKIMSKKPKEPKMPKCMNLEFCLITRLSGLRKLFVSNGDISYYVFKITYRQTKQCPRKIKFIDARNGQWRTMKRDYIPIGPRCIDL